MFCSYFLPHTLQFYSVENTILSPNVKLSLPPSSFSSFLWFLLIVQGKHWVSISWHPTSLWWQSPEEESYSPCSVASNAEFTHTLKIPVSASCSIVSAEQHLSPPHSFEHHSGGSQKSFLAIGCQILLFFKVIHTGSFLELFSALDPLLLYPLIGVFVWATFEISFSFSWHYTRSWSSVFPYLFTLLRMLWMPFLLWFLVWQLFP